MGLSTFSRGPSIAVALLLLMQPVPSIAATCVGADPAVVSVVVKAMHQDGNINRYTLSGKVANLGSSAQAANTLQFVDIFRGSTKIDSRGIPALRSGESYTFQYIASRSAQAGDQTTALGFRMHVSGDASPMSTSCNAGNGTTMVRF